MRQIGWGTEFSNKFISICREQEKDALNRDELLRRIIPTQRAYTSKDLLNFAIARYKVK